MEAIGALASISQLLEYGLKIYNSVTEASKRIEGAKSRLQYYNSQIQKLTDIALLIQQNEQLQIPVVCAQVDSTVIQAKALLYTIQTATADYTEGSRNKRYWKAIRATKESQISAGFDRLEQEKGALSLCINVVQASAISDISSTVEIMSNKLHTLAAESAISQSQSRRLVKEEKSAILPESKAVVPFLKRKSNDLYDNNKSLGRIDQQKTRTNGPAMEHPSHEKGSQHRGVYHEYSNVTADTKVSQLNGDYMPETLTTNFYRNITAIGGSQQVNGNAGAPKASESSQGHSYDSISATGKGTLQMNGNIRGNGTVKDVRDLFF